MLLSFVENTQWGVMIQRGWRQKLCTTVLYFLVIVVVVTGDAAQQREVHDRMYELMDSVKDAVRDADAAVDKRQVVDLGQSLSLLETKFSGLRAALSHELGASKDKIKSQSTVARELMDTSADLVRGIVAQRQELSRLAGDIREMESAIRALREGLHTFDREMTDLNSILSDVHQIHHELSASHDEIRSRVKSVVKDGSAAYKPSPTHRYLVIAVVVELGAFVLFIFLKRSSRSAAHKAYGKFG